MYGTALIIISSPEGEDNWYSRIVNLKDDTGSPIFLSHIFRRICPKHRKMGPRGMTECKCIKGAHPMHKDISKRRKYQKAYEMEGKEEEDLQENYGVITRPKGRCFVDADIKSSIDPNAPRIRITTDDISNCVKLITVTIDPDCAGKCKTGIAIGFVNERTNDYVICHVSRKNTSTLDDFTGFVKDNIVDFRRNHRELRNKEIRVYTETNTRYDGDLVRKVIEAEVLMNPDIGPISYFSDDNIVRSGVLKNERRTKEYILTTFATLQNKHLHIQENFSTTNKDISISRVLLELREELCRFHWPDDEDHNKRFVRKSATGKGKGGRNDDMAVAVMMVVYFSAFARTLREYINPKKAREALMERLPLWIKN